MFLAAFLIGLREGLEAALIVGILAAFLARNESSLRPLIIATIAAVALSIAVAIGLNLFSTALPQAQQEALETVIGAVAVVFVTTMILWMNQNARSMKGELEGQASTALSTGGEKAMAGMAFLAIMKEGFETAVFLLAVFQASSGDDSLGVIGAAAGVAIAVGIGWLIYYGGARFNLGTFFKVTGPFLILVAAGFVANMFRTAHEAGWVNIGQDQVMDLSWLIQNDSVVSALLTGMFSIQADPRLIEVLAWLAYLIPVMVIYLWPERWRFSYAQLRRSRKGWAIACIVLAVALFVAAPRGDTDVAGATRAIEGSDDAASVTLVSQTEDTATISVEGADGSTEEVTLQLVSTGLLDTVEVKQWEATVEEEPDPSLPTTDITYGQLAQLNGGRAPSGVNHERNPGPYDATWSQSETYSIRTCGTSLLRASCTERLNATLSGGGISGTKTVSLSGAVGDGWEVSEEESDAAESAVKEAALAAEDLKLWWLWCPIALVGIGAGLFIYDACESRRREHKASAEAAA